MKKAFAILMAMVIMLCCVACGGNSGDSGAAGDRLAQIKEQGYIEMTCEPFFAPYEFIDPTKTGDAQYVGADIEIAKYIADKIGVEVKIVPLDWGAVQAGIVDGKYDMAISAMAYSPARAENMNLSNVYYFSSTGYGFMTRSEDADKYKTVEDLADAVVITQSGSVQEALYNEQVPTCKEFKLVANMTDGYLAVAEGKADVCICSTESAQLYADANGGLTIPEFRFDVDPNMNGTVVALPLKDTDSLMEVVNECIAELIAAGQVEAWMDEYAAYAAELGIE